MHSPGSPSPVAAPRPSPRALLAMAFAPSAGMGALLALGPMLDSFLPSARRLLRAIAIASWLVLAGVVVILAGTALALGSGGPLLLLAGVLLATAAFGARIALLVRLTRTIMAHPLVGALLGGSPADPGDGQG